MRYLEHQLPHEADARSSGGLEAANF
jgi:hypothetical protein